MSSEENVKSSNFAALLDFLAETPIKIAQLTSGFSPAELCLKNSDDEFSALENLCHLRDLELDGYTPRIKRILGEVDPALVDFDGARVAAESNYNSQQGELALQTFETARRANVAALRRLTDAQLKREGRLEGVGKVTLKQLAEMMAEHDEGHIEDLRVLHQRLNSIRSRQASGAEV